MDAKLPSVSASRAMGAASARRWSGVVVVAGLVVCGFAAAPARAQAGGDRVLIYVADVLTDDNAKVKQEAAALTSALCGILAKDKRVEVMCAPDLKQILSFAAASAMIGGSSPAAANVEKRLASVKYVVAASLAPRGADIVLTVQAGPKSENADVTALFAETAFVKVEEVSPAKQMKLLERLPDVSARILKGILAAAAAPKSTTSDAPPPAGPPPPPPAPLKK